jgi:hypothetical protein
VQAIFFLPPNESERAKLLKMGYQQQQIHAKHSPKERERQDENMRMSSM